MKILNEDMSIRVEEAACFARKWHMGQCRPNSSQEPKINHIEEVAQLVTDAGGGYIEVMAAWLHDIVEDTAVTLEEIGKKFGSEVEILVDGLTDPVSFVDLPLAQRKDLQVQRLRNKHAHVKMVKLADQISNVRSVLQDPPLGWSESKSLIYVVGAERIADVCAGLYPCLDKKFLKSYQAALKKYE